MPSQSEQPAESEKDDTGRKPARQLFSAAATTLFRIAIFGVFLFATGLSLSVYGFYHSPYWNDIGIAPAQPVLFSHRHHAGELRIDCRNCHSGVETSAFAGMPSTQTCLSCHSQIFTNATMLEPVVKSGLDGTPIVWTRVTRLPDHVYFNHSIHVNKGVGCTSCHGDVGNMAVTAKATPMTMRWCLDCHKNPGPQLRPQSEVFLASVPADASNDGRELLGFYQIHTEHLTNCSTCHH
jgi:hypothetical protein